MFDMTENVILENKQFAYFIILGLAYKLKILPQKHLYLVNTTGVGGKG